MRVKFKNESIDEKNRRLSKITKHHLQQNFASSSVVAHDSCSMMSASHSNEDIGRVFEDFDTPIFFASNALFPQNSFLSFFIMTFVFFWILGFLFLFLEFALEGLCKLSKIKSVRSSVNSFCPELKKNRS